MDTNYYNNNLDTIYLENIENYVIINESMYKTIIANIKYNHLFILFMFTCLSTILCLNNIQKKKNKKSEYVLIQDAEPVKGEVLDKV